MLFNFTFSFGVPGIVNPFSAQAETTDTSMTPAPVIEKLSRSQVGPRSRPEHASLPPPAPLNKKRGWAPSSSEPSQAVSVKASSSGYIDTAAKYRDMVEGGAGYDDREQSAEVEAIDSGMYMCHIFGMICLGSAFAYIGIAPVILHAIERRAARAWDG